MKHSRAQGMTLVEVMIAVAVLAMVTTLVYGGFSQTMINKNRIEETAARYHEVSSALERMARELSMAYVSAQLNPNESLQVMRTAFVGTDRGARDRLDFTSFSHQRLYRDAHESDQNEISYFMTAHPRDRDKKVLARREQHRLDDDPTRGGRVEIVVEDIEEFELEYLDPNNTEWVREWNTTNAGGHPNLLPAQVKIRLQVPAIGSRRRRRSQTFVTRATLPIRYGLNHATYNP